jgi:hypothetical protein
MPQHGSDLPKLVGATGFELATPSLCKARPRGGWKCLGIALWQLPAATVAGCGRALLRTVKARRATIVPT